MVLKLYSLSFGPPSIAVHMAMEHLNLNFELIEVDFVNGYHRSEEYAKMSPQMVIPVLDADGFYLSESNAILQYLADRYSSDYSFYPKNLEKRAIVNHRLAFNLSTYYRSIEERVIEPMIFGYFTDHSTTNKVKVALSVFETYLEKLNKNYAADDVMTIADLQLAATTMCLEAIEFDISGYPKVSEWYKRFKTNNPYLWIIADKGLKQIALFLKHGYPDINWSHPIHHFTVDNDLCESDWDDTNSS